MITVLEILRVGHQTVDSLQLTTGNIYTMGTGSCHTSGLFFSFTLESWLVHVYHYNPKEHPR